MDLPHQTLRVQRIFMRRYKEKFGDDCAKYDYSKRKWKILKCMTKAELLEDYKPGEFIHMKRDDIQRVLKNNNGIVRSWIWLQE